MARDILIVEDERITLNGYGNLVQSELNIVPFLTNDPTHALEILKNYPIKVLVTDQLMKPMKGTELVQSVRNDLGLNIPCIMVTGRASRADIAKAIRLGFTGFVDKDYVTSELIPEIKRAIRRYDMEELSRHRIEVNKILSSERSFIKFNTHVTFRIVRVTSIINRYTREQDWRTVYHADRNIHTTTEVSIKRRVSASCEYDIDREVTASAGLKAGKLISELELALNQQYKISVSEKVKNEEEVAVEAKQTIEVTEITDTPNPQGLILRSREYQAAPAFTRINCLIEASCSCCLIPKEFTASIDLPTNEFALRQVEHFDRGSDNVIYTGFQVGNLEI